MRINPQGRTLRVPLRIVIANDGSRLRQGLRALLATRRGMNVIGVARDGRQALGLVDTPRPDAVVMDARMPAMDGLTATWPLSSSSSRRCPL